MSIAYIILAHKLPSQVRRLVSTLLRDSSDIVLLHVDKKSRSMFSDVWRHLVDQENVTMISEYEIGWGSFSTVQALLHALNVVLKQHPEVSHIKHLSGQDYPIQRIADVRHLIKGLGISSSLEHHQLPWQTWIDGGEPSGGLDRLAYARFKLFRREIRLPLRQRLPSGVQFYGGSALWCLCRTHAETVLQKCPAYYKWFRRGSNVDELFFHTVLATEVPTQEIVNNDFTYTQWSAAAPSPAILRLQDASSILDSGCWFARKFDYTVDNDIIDLLDRRISTQGVAG